MTETCTIEYKSTHHQCSAAAMKLAGSVFQNGLCITQFVRALRQSGLRISNDEISAVIDAYMKSTYEEYKEQQARIDKAL